MIQTIKLIEKFEKFFNVESWVVNNLKIWPVLRIPLITIWEEKLFYSNEEYTKNRTSFSTVYRDVATLYRSLKSLTHGKRTNNVSRADVVVYGYDSGRRISYNNRDYSVFADAMQSVLGKNVVVRAIDWNRNRDTNPYNSNYDYTMFATISKYLAKAYGIFSYPSIKNIPYQDVKEWCNENKVPSQGINKRDITRLYSQILIWKHYHKILLRLIRPQVVYIEDFYGTYGFGIIMACKEQQIKVYDLQHGVAGASYHRAYCNWTRHPKEGYQMMPDGYWCWNRQDQLAIQKWGAGIFTPPEVIVGGKLEKLIHDKQLVPTKRYNDDLKTLKSRLFSKIIVISIQHEILSEIFIQLIKESPKNWLWCIRCHPSYGPSTELINLARKESNCEYLISSKLPAYSLLNIADCHVTLWSTFTLDAYYSGVPTVLLHKAAIDYFSYIIDDKHVQYSDSIVQSIKCISESTSFSPIIMEPASLDVILGKNRNTH
jgi:hypothetical protein